jgi:cobalt-zinc-cadmium efflux system protein
VSQAHEKEHPQDPAAAHEHHGHGSGAHDHGGPSGSVHAHAHGHEHGGHGHGAHTHVPSGIGSRGEAARRALWRALVLNAAFLALEASVGWATGSLALLSDAAHMVSDVAAITLALWAAHMVLRPPTPKRTFGLLRAEVLGAFINAVGLIVVSFFIFKEAIERLLAGAPRIDPLPVIGVATIGIAINLGSAWFLYKSDDNSLNVRGALLHMLADAASSVGALLAGLCTLLAGWTAADAIMGLVIGTLVLWATWGTLRHSTAVLLDFAPPGLGQDVVYQALKNVAGIVDVHELHIWTLGSGHATVTAHLVIENGAEAGDLLQRAETALLEYGIRHTTLQIDAAGSPCSQLHCPVLVEA